MSIDERFRKFHERNPEILDLLIELARDAKRRGFQRYGLKALWEVLRYQAGPTGGEKYKLSNDFTSRYARLVVHHAPDLDGFFVLKKLSDSDVRAQLSERDDELELEIDAQLMADGIW